MLDTASHLSSFGWKGHGTALREGAITRPLLVSQKKSLSGLGKDRDEAFPFWDHVFAAAAKTITIKVHGDSDDDSSDTPESSSAGFTISRTSTGIISNRRPTTTRTPPSSTPGDLTPTSSTQKISVMALAKQEAAKRALYAQFYRGPLIAAKDDDEVACGNKRRRASVSSGSDSTDTPSHPRWKTLAATVTSSSTITPATASITPAPVPDMDKAARKAARAERKAAKAERRAARAAKREKKRLKAEAAAATETRKVKKRAEKSAGEEMPTPVADGVPKRKKRRKADS